MVFRQGLHLNTLAWGVAANKKAWQSCLKPGIWQSYLSRKYTCQSKGQSVDKFSSNTPGIMVVVLTFWENSRQFFYYWLVQQYLFLFGTVVISSSSDCKKWHIMFFLVICIWVQGKGVNNMYYVPVVRVVLKPVKFKIFIMNFFWQWHNLLLGVYNNKISLQAFFVIWFCYFRCKCRNFPTSIFI